MFDPKLLVGSAVLAALLSGCGGSSSSSDDAGTPPSGGDDGVAFSFVESTVADLHTSLETGGVTCEEVVQGYIDRIEAYDDTGSTTELNSVVAINPEAIIDAREKDLNFAVTGIDGPLYCVPVLPKDNFNTEQMPTSGGALAFQYNQPTRDAYTVRRMREAGAIVLGKANMDEFAFGFRGESSVRGLVKNPYDLTKGSGGSSTGTLLSAALRYCREQTTPKRVVSLVCDSGNKYLTKMYNDHWMFQQGLLERAQQGNLVDLIVRRYQEGSTVTVEPGESLMQAYRRMTLFDVSQLPVMEGRRLIGILDESDLLMHVQQNPERFENPVSDAMVREVETLPADASMDALLAVFQRVFDSLNLPAHNWSAINDFAATVVRLVEFERSVGEAKASELV